MDQLSILAVTKTADTINRDPNMTEKKKKESCTLLLTELQLKEGIEYGNIIEI